MTTEYFQPDKLFSSNQYGFSQVSVSEGSTIISLAGQVAIDADENIIGPGNLELQTKQTLKNIEHALAYVNAGLQHITLMRIYVVLDLPSHSSIIADVLKDFFKSGNYPPSSWIGVSGLARPEFLIEIEVVAVL